MKTREEEAEELNRQLQREIKILREKEESAKKAIKELQG